MNFDQALAYLFSLGHETLTIKLGLQNTETLLSALYLAHNVTEKEGVPLTILDPAGNIIDESVIGPSW